MFWFKVIFGQWCYVLCNIIVMCFVLIFVYYFNLDEFYWVMILVVVVSFLIVGGVISKSLGCIVGSLFGVIVVLIIVGYMLNEFWLFLFSMVVWIGFCIWVCVYFINNVVYVFQLFGYMVVIIVFLMVNIVEIMQLWDIVQVCVCEVIVGIFCGGMMMMILFSILDGIVCVDSYIVVWIIVLLCLQDEQDYCYFVFWQ